MTVTPVKHMTPVTGTLEEHEEKEIEMAYTTVTVVIKHLKGALVNNDIIDGSFMDDQDWELKSFTIEKTVCPPEEAAKPKADPFAADPTDWLAGS